MGFVQRRSAARMIRLAFPVLLFVVLVPATIGSVLDFLTLGSGVVLLLVAEMLVLAWWEGAC